MDEASNAMIKLTSSNFAIWKPRMENILYYKDLYDPLELKEKKYVDKYEANWKKMNMNTIGHIRQWIDQSVFHHVSPETDVNTLLTTLESIYEKKNAQTKTCDSKNCEPKVQTRKQCV